MSFTDVTVVLEEDVIAALRLAQVATADAEKFARVAEIILHEATPTPDTNRGGVELLIRLQKSGALQFKLDCTP